MNCSSFTPPGVTGRNLHVIIKKMEYYREDGSEKHLRDVTGILKVSAGEIDQEYIVKWAEWLDRERPLNNG